MRKFIILFLLFALVPALVWAQEVTVQVTNPASFDRPVETIEIPWAQLASMNIASGDQIAVFENDNQLISQTIDMNGDGTPDLLIFQSAFNKGQQKTFVIKRSAEKQEPKSITDAKYILPRKDVAWENDRIAFRIYGGPLAGDVRDGIDVWVKRVRNRIIDKWYDGDSLKGKKRVSYHVDHGEGADYFEVKKSLGAGGLTLWNNEIYHQQGLFSSQKIIATGPIRTVFTVFYDQDSIDGKPIRVEKTYTLDAGNNLNRIDARFEGLPNEGPVEVCAGLVKRPNTTNKTDEKLGWLSLYGATDQDSTHGEIGTAVVFPLDAFKSVREEQDHYLMVGSTSPRKEMTYFAGACWNKSGDFASANDWYDYLSRYAERLANPLNVVFTASVK